MQEILEKASGVWVPTLDAMSWQGTSKAENLFGCYGMIFLHLTPQFRRL